MEKFLLESANSALVIVDIQERLVPAMGAKEGVIQNCLHLIEAAKLLGLPIILTEQYPKGLGPTIPEIRDALPDYQPVAKNSFSCCGEPAFREALRQTGRNKVLLAGMETHVCVLQTAVDLLSDGYVVHLVSDAVCSRTKQNWKTGVQYVRDAGVVITCAETVLFQLLKEAGGNAFKTISNRLK
ncbi:MAG TPA: hydrolase [Dissulfurispiraceae bacterium]|nr:hydrolase [Dissulfurispiraceae bacterium]